MNLQDWLHHYIGYENYTPGLERIKKAISLMGQSCDHWEVVTVAGTNGKGQTSRRLHQLWLKLSDQDPNLIALWTSPHIECVTERFVRGERQIKPAELLSICHKLHHLFKENGLKLSYYEFLFACFLDFAADCKTLILEVGLGGRLDAVNALDAKLALVTSISRDHQAILGPRLENILYEKLAVARPNALLVTNLELRYLREKARKYAHEIGANFIDINDIKFHEKSSEHFKCKDFFEQNQLLAELAFGRYFKRESGIGSVQAQSIWRTFSREGASFHALGSHNPDGMRKGVHFLLRAEYTETYKLLLMSFSQRDDRDALMMLKAADILLSKKKVLNAALCHFDHEKAMPLPKLKELAAQAGWDCYNEALEVFKAYELAGEKVLVLGSYYFLGSLLAHSS